MPKVLKQMACNMLAFLAGQVYMCDPPCNEALQMGHPPPRYAWRLGSAELNGTSSAQHCIGQQDAMIEHLHLQRDLTPLDKALCSPPLRSSPVAMPCDTNSLPPRSDVYTTCILSSESLSIPLLWSMSLSTFSTVAVRAEPAHSCGQHEHGRSALFPSALRNRNNQLAKRTGILPHNGTAPDKVTVRPLIYLDQSRGIIQALIRPRRKDGGLFDNSHHDSLDSHMPALV